MENKTKSEWATALIASPVPVLSSFILKHRVTVLDLLSAHSVDLDLWILLGYFQQCIKDASFPVLPHVPVRTPEHVGGVCTLLEVVVLVLDQQGNAGVGHHPDAGAAPDVLLVSLRGRVVHPENTPSLVDLLTGTSSEHLTWAGDQGTVVAVHVQELETKTENRKAEMCSLSTTIVTTPLLYWYE